MVSPTLTEEPSGTHMCYVKHLLRSLALKHVDGLIGAPYYSPHRCNTEPAQPLKVYRTIANLAKSSVLGRR
jgi:hypothetical protein